MPREKQPDGSEMDVSVAAEGFVALLKGERGSQVYTANLLDGSQWHFHIDRALALAQRFCTLFTIRLSECGITPERVLSQYPELDREYALTTDLSRPLLFVPRPDKPDEDICIDGWHRVWKALQTGQDEMFAYFLDARMADAVCVLMIPPGVERIAL